jgi:hypothetical protein
MSPGQVTRAGVAVLRAGQCCQGCELSEPAVTDTQTLRVRVVMLVRAARFTRPLWPTFLQPVWLSNVRPFSPARQAHFSCLENGDGATFIHALLLVHVCKGVA